MTIRRLMGLITGGAVVVGTLGLGSPAGADFGTLPLTLEVTRSGASPIVSGSGTTTEFTMVVTNPDTNPAMSVHLMGKPDEGLTLKELTSVGNRLDCADLTTYVDCIAYGDGIEAPDVQPGGTSHALLAPGESATVKVTYFAEAWVRTSTKTFCAASASLERAPGVEPIPAGPCGIAFDAPPADQALPQQVLPIWTEKTATVDVKALADLELTATGAPQTDPGKDATVTFQLKDLGPSLASNYKIEFTLPDGLTLVSIGASHWVCTQTGQKVECVWTPPQTAPGAEAAPAPVFDLLSVSVKTPNPAVRADYGITASASSDTEDPTPANATATAGIPMTPVDLAVAKSAGSPVFVGDEATWTVNVSNVGMIADEGKVTVTDTLPTGAVFKSAIGEGWDCTAQGQALTCTHTHVGLPVGASEDIVVISRMDARGDATNQVSVATTAYEKNLANNSASKVVRVKRAAQTTTALPPSPRRILSGTTDQGQKLTTRVRCTPVKASVAGEVSYCKVRKVDGVVRVKVFGSTKMKVVVLQTAKGSAKFKPFVQRKTYIVKP